MSDRMKVEVNDSELAEFLLDRDISLERGIIDYINSRFRTQGDVLYAEEERLREKGIFRCMDCGYWTEINKESFSAGSCDTCAEMAPHREREQAGI